MKLKSLAEYFSLFLKLELVSLDSHLIGVLISFLICVHFLSAALWFKEGELCAWAAVQEPWLME